MSWNCDLSLDEALGDPMIAAVLRADRVDTRQFEALLRAAARRIAPPRDVPPLSYAAGDQLRSCGRRVAEGCRAP